MVLRRFARPLLRFAFHLFYNPFAFTYDIVSALVSRGRWRVWTRQAIPRIGGPRVLEVPCGTGNLELDLAGAGYRPVAVDLSPSMLNITRRKLLRAGLDLRLLRARVQALPFAASSFDTVIMTFPPEFVSDPHTFDEVRRVLSDQGCLVWVDAGRLLPRDFWSRFLNEALNAVGGEWHFESMARQILKQAGFDFKIEWVQDDASQVAVVTARKEAR